MTPVHGLRLSTDLLHDIFLLGSHMLYEYVTPLFSQDSHGSAACAPKTNATWNDLVRAPT